MSPHLTVYNNNNNNNNNNDFIYSRIKNIYNNKLKNIEK